MTPDLISPVGPSTAEAGRVHGSAAADRAFAGPVAYIMSRFPLLTETFILREMLELEDQGVALSIFPLLRAAPAIRHAEVELLRGQVHFTPFLSSPIIAANVRIFVRNPSRYLRLLWSVVRGNWGSFNLLMGAVGVFPKSVYFARLVERLGIQHIHAHFATHPALSALIASELAGIGFSFTAHAHDIFLHKQMLGEKARKARFVVAISDFNRDFLMKLAPDLPADRIKVLRCGIRLDQYGQKQTASSSGGATALCVASLQPYKGLKVLLAAAARIVEKVPAFRCLIVGEGHQRAELEALIADLGLHDVVQLLGGRSQDEVAHLLGRADLFVLPSVVAPSGQMEGIPVALMEAMASRLPVVSTRISGIPELIEDKVSGFLVPPGDEAALTEAILSLCRDPELRKRMGDAGCAQVAAGFQLQPNVAQLRTFFAQAVVNHGAWRDPESRHAHEFGPAPLDPGLAGWAQEHLHGQDDRSSTIRTARIRAGRDSEVYRISRVEGGRTGAELILKLHRPNWSEASQAVQDGGRHARTEYEALTKLWGEFRRRSTRHAVPKPIDFCPHQAALLMELQVGEKLYPMMRWARFRPGAVRRLNAAFETAGEWLALFHTIEARSGDAAPQIERVAREFDADLEICRRRGLDPSLAFAAARSFAADMTGINPSKLRLVSRHCDFAPYNVFINEERVSVIDFEGMQDGIPTDDLCYFLSMIAAVPPHHLGHSTLGKLQQAFLRGYARRGVIETQVVDAFMLPATIKIMAWSPVLDGGSGLVARIERSRLLSFFHGWLRERLT